jgi:hypothetical protein
MHRLFNDDWKFSLVFSVNLPSVHTVLCAIIFRAGGSAAFSGCVSNFAPSRVDGVREDVDNSAAN